MILERVV